MTQRSMPRDATAYALDPLMRRARLAVACVLGGVLAAGAPTDAAMRVIDGNLANLDEVAVSWACSTFTPTSSPPEWQDPDYAADADALRDEIIEILRASGLPARRRQGRSIREIPDLMVSCFVAPLGDRHCVATARVSFGEMVTVSGTNGATASLELPATTWGDLDHYPMTVVEDTSPRRCWQHVKSAVRDRVADFVRDWARANPTTEERHDGAPE